MSSPPLPPAAAPVPSVDPEEALARLRVGAAQIVSEAELREKLRLGRPLRVKLGVDPTSADLHLGHSLVFLKMRQFQDLGHQGVLIIGDFTAMVGDPTGRSATRPQLTHEEVLRHAATYQEQAWKVLDPARTEVVFNGSWFRAMGFEQVIRLNSRVTLQQILQREDFKERVAQSVPVSLHEIQYPLMQGWDSVMVRADVELGATDQLFNIMVGRDLQKEEGQPPQVALLSPILEGLDGVQKMSKSLGNYVGIAEPPAEIFGKLMSVSDELMGRYYPLLLGTEQPAAAHPMEAKKHLAARVVARFHSEAAARTAREDFEARFSRRDVESAELPAVSLDAGGPADVVSVVVTAYDRGFGQAKSRGEVRRLVEGGSVQWRGQKVTDPKATLDLGGGGVLKLDKLRTVRIA